MSEVADAVRTFPIIYDITQRELYRKVLDDLKNGTVKEIDTDLYEAYGNGLRKAVDTVLGESEYGDEYFDMQMQMRANVSRFAAYKAYHATQELKDVDPADIDKKGKLILNKYNRWQAAEYNTAVARTRTAKQYHDFTSDPISNELYPNIKWLPSRSASPREAHRVFWNRVWAKNDPFWNSNTPGSLWNCKCDWEETDEPVTDKNPNGTMSAKGLEGNPAVTGEIFTKDCPYVKKGNMEIVNNFGCSYLRFIGKNVNFVSKSSKGDIYIDKVCANETAKSSIKNPKYWLKNELMLNLDKYLPTAQYVGNEPIDLTHNSKKGKAYKLKKKSKQFHEFAINFKNEKYTVKVIELNSGKLLAYTVYV